MNRKCRKAIGFAAAMLCVSGASQAMAAPAQEPESAKAGPIVEGFQVVAQTAEDNYTPMTPIVVSLSLRNTTDELLTYVDSHTDGVYDFVVTDEKGKAIPRTSFGQAREIARHTYFGIGTQELLPGLEQKDEVLINRYFDMTLEGVYLVKFIRLMVPKLDKSGITTAESNTVRIVVNNSIWPRRKPVPADANSKRE